ncbi:MAG: baseplate J/gp47 family protein [Armatimonadota bacterium]|nr:baseplate J/gp47 family protein [bacterium]
MTVRRGRLPYVDKDYESIREELIARIPQLTERWTDFNTSDLGVVLLELFSGIADMLAYYVDSQAAECYLPTARQRQNIVNLCALVGYKLHGPIAASTQVRFTLSQALTENITIPSGTALVAPDETLEVPFVTVSDAVISAGQSQVDVDAVQGELVTEEFTGTGAACASITLSRTDVAYGSIHVSVAGTQWTQVEHFVESGPEDPHYVVSIDGLDNVSIIFGDGTNGAFPGNGKQIVVTYYATLGSDGNLAPHRVTKLVSVIYATSGEAIKFTVDNPVAATGGADRETQDHAKLVVPTTVKSTWKAVTRDDYSALCLAFPGVAKAKIMDVNDDSSLRIYTVRICIAPEGGGLPSELLKSDLTGYLEARRLLTMDVGIVDPVYLSVDINAALYIYPGEDVETVRTRAQRALDKYFAFDSQDFGQKVYLSDLVALLDGVSGVSHVVLSQPFADVISGSKEIPTLGTVTLNISEVQ